jgi:hypothetical protein
MFNKWWPFPALWVTLAGALWWLFRGTIEHALFSWLIDHLTAAGITEPNTTAFIVSNVVPLAVAAIVVFFVYIVGRSHGLQSIATQNQARRTASTQIRTPRHWGRFRLRSIEQPGVPILPAANKIRHDDTVGIDSSPLDAQNVQTAIKSFSRTTVDDRAAIWKQHYDVLANDGRDAVIYISIGRRLGGSMKLRNMARRHFRISFRSALI